MLGPQLHQAFGNGWLLVFFLPPGGAEHIQITMCIVSVQHLRKQGQMNCKFNMH